jgi:eukaryotic-like serine/threonine-protein kinase
MTSGSGPHSLPPMSLPYPPGTVLAGKYRVERLLGKGGMGWVVVATHLQLEQRVALKFMNAEHAAEHPDSVARFLREARAAARIQSEHVARVSDVGTLDNGSPYLVMEYLEGRDMEALIRSEDKLPTSQLIGYVLEACEGLAEAHAAGIVHRDLKPANLFLARRTDGSVRVKLLDFGISKLTNLPGSGPEVGMTSTQALMGSPLYMSPEQLRSSKNVDRRTDIWSMGVILYECLAGSSPFEAETLPEVCARIMAEPPPPLKGVARGLDAVVMKCLEKDAPKRFADTGALATALAAFGGPDARAQAERIVRVARSSNPNLPGVGGAGSSGEMPALNAATAVSGIGQTNASLVRSSQVATRRVPAARVIVGAGIGVLGIGLVVALVATRSKHPETTSDPAAAAAAPASAAPSAVASASASTPVAPVAPSASAAEATTADTADTSTAAPRHPAAPTAPGRKPATPGKATGAASAAPTAKPASTNGFGGRD